MANGGLHATYQYDANGNRTNAIVGGVSNTGQVDDQDRLLSYGSATYQYDNHGTLTNKTDGGQTTAYQYDARGSLLGVQYGTNEISYTVDALGRRISRTKNGATTQRFVYQGFLSPVAELNSDGSVATRFVYATRANVPDYMVQGSSTYRIITDIRGSVRLVVNADTRVIVQRMDYDEWGQVTQDTNPGFQPFGFAGGLYDPDTGLVRFGFRDYDPEVGRWIAKDPILFAGGQLNLYLYCYGDPINLFDPLGLRSYSDRETKKILGNVGSQNVVQAVWNHSGGRKYDFKIKDFLDDGMRNDTYTIDGIVMNSDQFGNFAAGYAGYKTGWYFGVEGALFGGGIYDYIDAKLNSFEDAEFDWDMDSWSDIITGGYYAQKGEMPPVGK